MTRLLNVTATALIIALAAFLFAGCGEEAPTTKASTKTSTSKSKGGAAGGSSTTKVENLIGQVITPTDQSPKDFSDSVKKRRPVVVLFYMTGPSAYDDSQVRSTISTLESRYRGQVDFYTYLYSDGARYMDLAMLLNVNTTPSLIIINKQATVQRAWTGYADNLSIEQGVLEATKT